MFILWFKYLYFCNICSPQHSAVSFTALILSVPNHECLFYFLLLKQQMWFDVCDVCTICLFFWRYRGNLESMSWLKPEWNIWRSVTNIAIIFKGSQGNPSPLHSGWLCDKELIAFWLTYASSGCVIIKLWKLQYSSSCGWTTRVHSFVFWDF